MMLRTLIRHDWKVLAADRTLLLVALLLVTLAALGAANGARFRDQRAAAVERVVAENERALREDRGAVLAAAAAPSAEPWNDPANPYRRRAVATLSPGPLAGLAVGMADLLPYWSNVSIYTLPSAPFRFHELGNPLHFLAGGFDLAFAVVALLPLVILALGYDLLSGEKESGTLALLASSPVPPRKLALAKVASRGSLALAITLVASLAALAAAGTSLLDPGVLPRAALWAALVVLYGAFWLALALAVQARGRSSAANAVTLIACWLAWVVLAPAALHLLASGLHPVPSRYAYLSAERAADNASQQVQRELLRKLAMDHPELLPEGGAAAAEDWITRYYAVRLDLEERLRPEEERFAAALAAQQRLVDRYRFLSPAVLAQQGAVEIAGSGLHRHRIYVAAVRKFIPQWRAFLVPKVFAGHRMTPADFDAVPRFSFVEEGAAALLWRLLPTYLGLLVPTALLAWWGLPRLRDYSPVS
jgi:ABC-2 type transport system permease protein